jgi:hypothetical protein
MKVILSKNIFGVSAKSFLYKVFTLERKQQTMLRPVFFFFFWVVLLVLELGSLPLSTGIVIKQQKTYSMFYSNVTTKQINMNSYLIQVSSIFNNNYSFS